MSTSCSSPRILAHKSRSELEGNAHFASDICMFLPFCFRFEPYLRQKSDEFFIDADENDDSCWKHPISANWRSRVCRNWDSVPLVQLFLWHQQSQHSPDSHCAFFGHTDSNVLHVGIAYTSGRAGNLMLHLHQLVPRGWPHGRCSIGAI